MSNTETQENAAVEFIKDFSQQASEDLVDALAKNESNAIALRIATIKAELESVKPLYDELDRLTVQLQDATGGNEVELQDRYVRVVDNFAEKNTVFRPTGVKRFEAVIETKEERTTRLEKAAKKNAKAKL